MAGTFPLVHKDTIHKGMYQLDCNFFFKINMAREEKAGIKVLTVQAEPNRPEIRHRRNGS